MNLNLIPKRENGTPRSYEAQETEEENERLLDAQNLLAQARLNHYHLSDLRDKNKPILCGAHATPENPRPGSLFDRIAQHAAITEHLIARGHIARAIDNDFALAYAAASAAHIYKKQVAEQKRMIELYPPKREITDLKKFIPEIAGEIESLRIKTEKMLQEDAEREFALRGTLKQFRVRLSLGEYDIVQAEKIRGALAMYDAALPDNTQKVGIV